MKLTSLLLTISFLHVCASGWSQKVTLRLKSATLQQVFREIKKQTSYVVITEQSRLESGNKVTIQVHDAPLKDVLDLCFKDQPYTYIIEENKYIVIQPKIASSPVAVPADQQTRFPVNGHVVGPDGKPLAGATVFVKGSNVWTATNDDGSFSLDVSTGDVLIITYVGYQRTEATVGSSGQQLTIALKPSDTKLEEVQVVTTGYQSISKVRSAGAFAKPDMTTIANRSTSMNILQRLDGLIPGLTVNNAPGASQYLIRGTTTISISTAPLYVVDGLPLQDISYINPQDVADITVLKDATAASIWGARAANGVIVITTKKGQRGENIKVNYDAFINIQGKPRIDYFPVLNSQQFIQAAKETFDPVANPYANVSTFPNTSIGLAPHEVILYNQYLGKITADQANKSLDSLAAINNTQQIRDLYRNAMLMNHTVSISGGQKNYAVYGSMAYTDARSYSPGQSDNTYKINLRQDFNIGKRIQLGLITDLTNQVTNSPRTISPTNQLYPYQLFRDEAGKSISMPYMSVLSDDQRKDFEARSRISLDYNPLAEWDRGYTKGDMLLSRNILNAKVKIIDGLNFEGSYGYVKGTSRTRSFDDAASYTVRAQMVQFTVAPTANSTPVYYLPAGGNYSITNVNQRNWTVRNQFTYDKNWRNGLHQLTMLAGQEAQEQNIINNFSSVRGWDPRLQVGAQFDYKTLASTGVANTVWANNFGYSTLSEFPFTQSQVISRFTSYYGNAAYTFDHKYTINGSYRVDKSNNFGLDKAAQNKPVWSIGGKWIITQEPFMKASWINNLALRATYGLTGNAPNPGTAASYDIMVASQSSFFPNGLGLQLATPANRILTWESTATVNFGVDFALLNNRLSGSLDVYRKRTTQLLGNLTTILFTGYTSLLGNLGDLENKGVELSLTSVNLRSKHFAWSTTLNGAYNKNKITQLNIAAPITTGDGMMGRPFLAGYAAYALFAYQYAGLDNMGDPQIRLSDKTVTKTPFVSKPGDVKYMGTAQPVWSGGLSNTFRYRSFSLTLNAVFNLGNVMFRDANQKYAGRLTHLPFGLGGFSSGNLNADFANRWKKPGDELITDIPSFLSNTTTSNSRRYFYYYSYGDINVVNAGFVKMRDITLTYGLPDFITRKISADQVTLRAQVSNLAVWRGNKYGIDPEFQSAYTGTRNLPSNQGTVSFGLNVRF